MLMGNSLLEGDVKKSMVDGIPLIEFSKRIHQLLVNEMSISVVFKLLGRNIGFVALQNKLYGIWRPSKPFQLMDIENGYFLAKFQSLDDYEKILTQGPWLIFGQYLTIQRYHTPIRFSLGLGPLVFLITFTRRRFYGRLGGWLAE
ncbi:hypothetical protein J1N35_025133 [Gossypium stocksii]|uniref:DUF4283 domain-containing protein n=1 Tax=Gossypium stocksii TaxID=47602 RepID=A0A9D3V605_9ROSI|nr:hypothetical protein J1N35_025133 [Gossypium stocksii]